MSKPGDLSQTGSSNKAQSIRKYILVLLRILHLLVLEIQINTTVLPMKLITKTEGTQASAKGENISNLHDAFHVYRSYR